jgi:hypothetical protein
MARSCHAVGLDSSFAPRLPSPFLCASALIVGGGSLLAWVSLPVGVIGGFMLGYNGNGEALIAWSILLSASVIVGKLERR